jgi:hypothetical protein
MLLRSPTLTLQTSLQLETLITHFLNSEHLYFPIVHVPTFQARLAAFNTSNATEAPLFLGLVFAMLAHEMSWQGTEPGATAKAALEKENAGKRFCEASLEALRMGGSVHRSIPSRLSLTDALVPDSYLERPTFEAVRALLVLHRYGEQNMDARSTHFLSQAVQLGQVRADITEGMSFAEDLFGADDRLGEA